MSGSKDINLDSTPKHKKGNDVFFYDIEMPLSDQHMSNKNKSRSIHSKTANFIDLNYPETRHSVSNIFGSNISKVEEGPELSSLLQQKLVAQTNSLKNQFQRLPDSPKNKSWRLYCFKNAFVIEPNIPEKGIKFMKFNNCRVQPPVKYRNSQHYNLNFETSIARSASSCLNNCDLSLENKSQKVTFNAAVESPKLFSFKSICQPVNKKSGDDGIPQLIIYRHINRILDKSDASHNLYDSFGLLDCMFIIDSLLGVVNIADAKFLAVAKDTACIGGFTMDSFTKKLEPISKLWDAQIQLITKAWLIPFHLALDRLESAPIKFLAPSQPVTETNSSKTYSRTRLRHQTINNGGSYAYSGESLDDSTKKSDQPKLSCSSSTGSGYTSWSEINLFDNPEVFKFKKTKLFQSNPDLFSIEQNKKSEMDDFIVESEPNWAADNIGFGDFQFNELLGEKLAGYKQSIEILLSSKTFYFSYDIDITNSLQKKRLMNYNFVPQNWPFGYKESCSSKCSDDNSPILLKLADRRFTWNAGILESFSQVDQRWFTPVVQGSIFVSTLSSATSMGADIVLISRKSAQFAGTRYNARGINEDGSVANFNETEQMILLWDTPKNKVNEIIPHGWAAYVQVRGSVPIFWKQVPNSLLKASTQFTREIKFTFNAFKNHYDTMKEHYGDMCFINLLSTLRVEEQRLTSFFKDLLDEFGEKEKPCHYRHFDFHQLVKTDGLEPALKYMIDKVESITAKFGYYCDEILNPLGIVAQSRKFQHGVFRTNCLDCLDRTNAFQWWLAWSWTHFYLSKRAPKIFFSTGHRVYLSNLLPKSQEHNFEHLFDTANSSWFEKGSSNRDLPLPTPLAMLMDEIQKSPTSVLYGENCRNTVYFSNFSLFEKPAFASSIASLPRQVTDALPLTCEDLFLQKQLVKNISKDVIADLWATHGDLISFAYTGTGSVISELIRRGKTTIKTTIDHYKKTINRIYQNTFEDKNRQEAIELLLCQHHYLSPVTQSVFDVFSSNIHSVISEPVKSLRIWYGTWNLGGKAISEPLENWLLQDSVSLADIYVFAFQEFVELNSVRILLNQNDKEKILKLNSDIHKALGDSFLLLQSHTLVGLHTVIFVRESLKNLVFHVQLLDVKLGFKRQIGNKGAILLRLQFGGTSFCFVNVHFTAGVEKSQKRKAQLNTVLNSTFNSRPSFIARSHDCAILGGDFNFRCEVNSEACDKWISSNSWNSLLPFDQFLLNKETGDPSFKDLYEAPITFAPSYKFIRGTNNFDRGRVPSWCDRILYTGDYLKQNHTKDWIKCLEYCRFSEFLSSDHKPVYGIFQVSVMTCPR